MQIYYYMYFTIRDILKQNLINLGIFSQGTKSGVFLRSHIPDIGVLKGSSGSHV